MIQELLAVVVTAGQTFTKILPISIGVALLFTVLTWFWSCNPGRAWWQKSDLVTDLCYWLIIPIITRFLRIGMLIAVAAIVLGITSGDGLVAFYEHGHGPLATLPLVAQGIIFLIGQDFIMYWTHRWFHGETMWKYHAVHHSSEELEWISAARFHPINLFLGSVVADVTMLFAGISPTIFVVLGPLTVAHSAFVHANLPWTLGPFKYIFAGPVFHRWHHTSPDRGGEKNSPAHSRCSTSCSARSTCRKANFRTATASTSAITRRPSARSSSIRSSRRRGSPRLPRPPVWLSKRHHRGSERPPGADLQFIHQFAVN